MLYEIRPRNRSAATRIGALPAPPRTRRKNEARTADANHEARYVEGIVNKLQHDDNDEHRHRDHTNEKLIPCPVDFRRAHQRRQKQACDQNIGTRRQENGGGEISSEALSCHAEGNGARHSDEQNRQSATRSNEEEKRSNK